MEQVWTRNRMRNDRAGISFAYEMAAVHNDCNHFLCCLYNNCQGDGTGGEGL